MNEFELVTSLLREDRSIRRFDESRKITENELRDIVGLTRYCASGRNLQPLKYRIVSDQDECAEVFETLKWAGYLSDWDGPDKGERPVAYLVQCLDMNLTENPMCDDGIQLQTITLGARAKGIGACIIKSFNIINVKEILKLNDNFKPLYVIALGFPIEEVVIDDMKPGDTDIKYYRTADGVHHVPKRLLEDLLI